MIGANGKGKSHYCGSLQALKLLTAKGNGDIMLMKAFYAQHQLEALNVNDTILEEMKACGSQMTELELRSLLGCFLFSGDDADKKSKY